jgi:type I restriction enzyme S subunit
MVRYLRAANVKDGVLDLSDVLEMDFSPAEQRRFALVPGDVLVTEGAGSLAAVGASAVWSGEIAGTVCFQNHLLRLRARPGNDPRFLKWWARHAHGSGLFAEIASGAQILNLGADRVRRLPIVVPGFRRQRAIADYLDAEANHIDALLSARRRQIELMAERFSALREERVTELLDEYGSSPLKRLARRIEQGWSPDTEAVPAEFGEWGVLKTSAVSSGEFDGSQNKRLPDGVKVDRRWVVKDGDLLVVRGSGSPAAVARAAIAITRGQLLLLPDLLYRVPLRAGEARFLAQALASKFARDQFEAAIRTDVGMTRKIRSEDLASVLVPAAPISVQQEVSSALERESAAIDRVREAARRQIELLLERRQALITAAVTGQLEIPGVVA